MINDLDFALSTLSSSAFNGPSSPSNAWLTTVAIISSGVCDGAEVAVVDAVVGAVGAAPASGIAGRSAVPLLILISNALALPLA